jgi:hypothetical protein
VHDLASHVCSSSIGVAQLDGAPAGKSSTA